MDSIFNKYKDEVKYDYIIQGSIKGKIVPLEDEPRPDEDQILDAMEEIEKQFDIVMFDEDYLNDSFPEPGLGRVYCRLDSFMDSDNCVQITFGISSQDKREDFTEQDLLEDVKEYMNCIDSNLDPVSVAGIEITDDPENSTKPTMLCFKSIDKATAKVIKEEAKMDLDNIDRTLVTNESITFRKDKILQEFKLTDDGIIELYKENKWIKSIPFSKSGLLRECKSLIDEGYILTEAEFKDENSENKIEDPESTKKELQQEVDDLKEIQGLKQEVDQLTDEILDESINIGEFPSTEQTQKELTQTEIRYLTGDIFTQEQKDWLINKFGSIEEFIKNIQEFNNFISTAVITKEEAYVNIDRYIDYLIQKGAI